MKKTNSALATMLPVTDFFVQKAESALRKAADRVADLRFFEQVLGRLRAGEDLSKELSALKRVDKKEAIQSVKNLIKRCKVDLAQGYWDIKSESITTKVKAEFIEDELVPRYLVEYRITIDTDIAVIKVETAGVAAEVHINTSKCKGLNEAQALDLGMREIAWSMLH